SVADAKAADLWGKVGPWKEYPFRMLRFRARSFALRDTFGDALRGLLSAEEAQDIEERQVTGRVIDDEPANVAELLAPSEPQLEAAPEPAEEPELNMGMEPSEKEAKVKELVERIKAEGIDGAAFMSEAYALEFTDVKK